MTKDQQNADNTEALHLIAKALRLLGNGNIERGDNSPGAIEGLAILTRDSNEKIAGSISDVADAIRELAQAVTGANQQD